MLRRVGLRSTLGLVFTLLLTTQVWAGANYDRLSPEDQARIQKGEQVASQTNGTDFWPDLFVAQRIEATPEESLAMYADVPLQKTYIKGLERSDVIANLAPNVVVAEYLAKINQPIGDETFSLQHTYLPATPDGTYSAAFTLVKARLIGKADATIAFEPLGNATLVVLRAHITVKGPFGSMAKQYMLKGAKQLSQVIVDQIHREKQQDPSLLEQQVDVLRKRFAHLE